MKTMLAVTLRGVVPVSLTVLILPVLSILSANTSTLAFARQT